MKRQTLHADDVRLEKWRERETQRLARSIVRGYEKAAKGAAGSMAELFRRLKAFDAPPAAFNLTAETAQKWRTARRTEELRAAPEVDDSSAVLAKAGRAAVPLILALCLSTSRRNGMESYTMEQPTRIYLDGMQQPTGYADTIRNGFAALLGGTATLKEYATRFGNLISSTCNRLINVARGAVNRAQNWARMQWMRLQNAIAGEKWGKMWDAIIDDRVRDSHAAMDGQIRRLDEHFITGAGHLIMYPGDTSAPIEEWINCRCNLRRVRIA